MMEWKSVFFRGRLGNKREIGNIGKEDIGERIGWKIVCLKLIMNNSVTLQFNMIKNLCRLAQKKKKELQQQSNQPITINIIEKTTEYSIGNKGLALV